MKNLLRHSYRRKLTFFLVLSFFWFTADTILTYLTPVLVETREPNRALVGLIISMGSVAGIGADLISSWLGNDRHYPFFYILGFIIALLVPLFLPIPGILPIIILIMLGGIQYELFSFGQEDFLSHHIERKHQTLVSSLLMMVVTVTSLAVPLIITPSLEEVSFQFPFLLYVVLMLLGFFYFFVFSPDKHKAERNDTRKKIGFANELRIWGLLTKKTSAVFIVMLTVMLMDAVFWTLGPLLTIQFASEYGEIAGLFVPLYMLPGLFVGVYAPKLAARTGDLRAAILSLLFGGIILISFALTESLPVLLLLTFLSSVFTTATFPIIEGVLAHLIDRLGEEGGHLIGLRGFATDIGYIVGPIFGGVVAQFFSIRTGFVALGVIITVVCLFLLVSKPKAIRLPRKKLHELEA